MALRRGDSGFVDAAQRELAAARDYTSMNLPGRAELERERMGALDVLADPASARPLRLERERLVCGPSCLRYSIRDGGPNFTLPLRARRPRVPVSVDVAFDRGRDALAVARGRARWSLPIRPG